MSKYAEILKGDVAPKSALNALARKVGKQGVQVDKLVEKDRLAVMAAAARGDMDLFVTRAELAEALETGERPVAWDAPPAEEQDD